MYNSGGFELNTFLCLCMVVNFTKLQWNLDLRRAPPTCAIKFPLQMISLESLYPVLASRPGRLLERMPIVLL